MKTVLTIAGSDSCGGAGIQADIKTVTMHGVYAMSAITALTAQNTLGVRTVLESTPEFLKQQIDAVTDDIYPDAVKIGMVPSGALMRVVADRCKTHHLSCIVLDPVMVATSGSSLMQKEALDTLVSELLPLACVITPNISEAEVLSEMKIHTDADMKKAAQSIGDMYTCNVLLKGGHRLCDANDLLYEYKNEKFTLFAGKRIQNPNTHGSGCTLSSAIAANLAMGYTLVEAVEKAKSYVRGALLSDLDLGKGSGPLNHAFSLKNRFVNIYKNENGGEV